MLQDPTVEAAEVLIIPSLDLDPDMFNFIWIIVTLNILSYLFTESIQNCAVGEDFHCYQAWWCSERPDLGDHWALWTQGLQACCHQAHRANKGVRCSALRWLELSSLLQRPLWFLELRPSCCHGVFCNFPFIPYKYSIILYSLNLFRTHFPYISVCISDHFSPLWVWNICWKFLGVGRPRCD